MEYYFGILTVLVLVQLYITMTILFPTVKDGSQEGLQSCHSSMYYGKVYSCSTINLMWILKQWHVKDLKKESSRLTIQNIFTNTTLVEKWRTMVLAIRFWFTADYYWPFTYNGIVYHLIIKWWFRRMTLFNRQTSAAVGEHVYYIRGAGSASFYNFSI